MIEHPITAVYDANILYPAPLRDLFIRLAACGLVRGKWTNSIHDEWIRSVTKTHPTFAERLERTRNLMNDAVRDCLVVGYESLIGSLQLPDLDDRHVLAAAISSNARAIITYNLKDFPQDSLEPFGIVAMHPDVLLHSLLSAALGMVCEAIRKQRESLRNPPRSAAELLMTFENLGLTNSVSELRKHSDLL